ncbi:HSP20-like chaperone [Punctularia strigosozonata HHB-11173 SS5]|uniref:HSP20-like chaperone n=1 Tax=Punctularia strigosozonata (strain HHB-11173) TaxID=741275 RepID=UPI0004416955|nr:HSP20-like chaperone [Punctularia strigosozonata HHB-11173 SS5]EIN11781.1 HSP20-like chaperone [Punctularia strigosozonata HHB-11173 SS5]
MSLSTFWYEPVFTPSDFDRLFEEAFNARTSNNGGQVQRSPGAASGPLRPRMDLHENKDSNTVTATFELPGLKKEDVSIDVHNNRLTISGESKVSSEHDENGYAVRERRFGKFSRSLQLPQGIKDGEIKASMENGVLTVTFPKSAPEAAPKKITIA